MSRSRVRDFCFTLNVDDSHVNWEPDFDGLCSLGDSAVTRGMCFQEEIGGNSQRQHYQGFIRLVNPRTLNSCKDLFESFLNHRRTHLAVTIDVPGSLAYCRDPLKRFSKEGMWEFGDLTYSQGKRNDLEDLRQVIEQPGWRHITLYRNHFGSSVRYMQGLEKAAFYFAKERQVDRDVKVYWFWGDTRTGKSRDARAGYKFIDYYRLPACSIGRVWFDGYEGETTLIIDEFNDTFMTLEYFNDLTDRYPMQLPIKGAFTWAEWKKVVITSQFHYASLYPFATQQQRDALKSRIFFERQYVATEKVKRDPENPGFFTTGRIVSHVSHHNSARTAAMEIVDLVSEQDEILPPAGVNEDEISRQLSMSATPTQLVEESELLSSSESVIYDTEDDEISSHYETYGQTLEEWYGYDTQPSITAYCCYCDYPLHWDDPDPNGCFICACCYYDRKSLRQ